MEIVIGHFNVKVGNEDIFRPIIEKERVHEISNDNGEVSKQGCMNCLSPV
jgi:hypothetical protein